MSHGVYGDMYHGYGYSPYGPYSPAGSPVPAVGHDGQLYGAQHYQYPSPYFQPITPTGGPYSSTTNASKGENTPSAAVDKTPLTVDNGNSNGVKGTTGPTSVRPTYQNSTFSSNGSYRRGAQNGYQDPRYGFDGVHSPIPWLDSPLYSDGQARNNSNISPVTNGSNVASRNQNLRPHSYTMGLQSPGPFSGVNTANGHI